jgi:SulP family sulfate permease
MEDRLAGGLVRFLVIDFRRVTGVDSSTVVSFVRLGQMAVRRGFTLVITGMNEEVRRALTRGGLNTGENLRFDDDIDRGLMWCENRLLAEVAPDLDVERPRSLEELTLSIVKDAGLAAELARYFDPIALDAGELLVEGGTPSDEMYFVGSGRGAVRVTGTGDVAVRVATIGPGAIVGEVAFYLDQPRNASVVVESPMTAWRFSRASLTRLKKESPDVAFHFHEGIAAMMAARLTGTNRLVVFLAD